jgi:hypothetical protein
MVDPNVYQFQPFPSTRYHPQRAPEGRSFKNQGELDAAGEGWVDTPAKFRGHTYPPVNVHGSDVKITVETVFTNEPTVLPVGESLVPPPGDPVEHPYTTSQIFKMKKDELLVLARTQYKLDVADEINAGDLKSILIKLVKGE